MARVGSYSRQISDIVVLPAIVRFCGETEAEHADTVDLLKEVVYDTAYLFAYSERGKTKAARSLPDDVPEVTNHTAVGPRLHLNVAALLLPLVSVYCPVGRISTLQPGCRSCGCSISCICIGLCNLNSGLGIQLAIDAVFILLASRTSSCGDCKS